MKNMKSIWRVKEASKKLSRFSDNMLFYRKQYCTDIHDAA